MIVSEQEMLEILRSSKDIILFEPDYKRKYIPSGLAKIITYILKQWKYPIHLNYLREYNGEACDLRKSVV